MTAVTVWRERQMQGISPLLARELIALRSREISRSAERARLHGMDTASGAARRVGRVAGRPVERWTALGWVR
jgi:hypothetical protein